MVLLIIVFMFIHSHLPSDGFDLPDTVGKFAMSCVRQQHTEKCSHYANCGKNKKWQTLHVHTCKYKQNVHHLDRTGMLDRSCLSKNRLFCTSSDNLH